ncbi:MAG: hypothetical protein IPL46_17110 [Saprospiraceae bacterium]|nr:hypothetical protein [Saprospiraceae bacterium]
MAVSSIPTSENVQIRVARIGSAIIVLNRMPGGNWQVHRRYERLDFPAGLQVGFVTYTDWEKVSAYYQNDHVFYHNSHVINDALTDDPTEGVPFNPDLIGTFDFARFDDVNVPGELAGVDLVTEASDNQLLSFLGYDSNPFCPQDFHVASDISTGQIVDAAAQNNLTASCLIQSQALVDFSAALSVELQEGFQVNVGAEFQAAVVGCNN